MKKICSKCGQEIHIWSQPYVMVRKFDLRSWKSKLRELFGPPEEKDKTRYHVSCPVVGI